MTTLNRSPIPPADWLRLLGGACAGSMPLGEAQQRVALYATMLAGRFSPAAFCRASLEHVAAACKFWPTYAETVERLTEWVADNAPRRPALPAPERLADDAADIRASWQDEAAVKRAIRTLQDRGAPPMAVATFRLAIRRHARQHLPMVERAFPLPAA